MSNEVQDQLLELLEYINELASSHRFIPEVVQSLEEMINVSGKNADYEKLKSHALGLGMYISDDFEFSESEIGTKILNVINPILRSEK